jgi:hypothetical protein
VVSFTPRPLYLRGNGSRYPLDRSLCGPQGRSGGGGEEKKSLPQPVIENCRSIAQESDNDITTIIVFVWLEFILLILDVPGSILGAETGFAFCGLSMFPQFLKENVRKII